MNTCKWRSKGGLPLLREQYCGLDGQKCKGEDCCSDYEDDEKPTDEPVDLLSHEQTK